jgi:la-related protein 4
MAVMAAVAESSSISSSSAPSFPRHRIHRRTKDQESKVAAGNNHPLPAIKESLPASGGSNSSCGSGRSSGVQFDLEAAAFPPLPGLDADHGKGSTDIGVISGGIGATGIESASQNRLSDVVKGTAKLKAAVKDKESGNQQSQLQQSQQQQLQQAAPPPVVINTASRSASPGASTGVEGAQVNALGNAAMSTNPANAAHALNLPTANNENTSSADTAALSTIALTPPSSPDK